MGEKEGVRSYRPGVLDPDERALDLGRTKRLEGGSGLGDKVENVEHVAAGAGACDDAIECLVRGEGRHDVFLACVRGQVVNRQGVLLVGGP